MSINVQAARETLFIDPADLVSAFLIHCNPETIIIIYNPFGENVWHESVCDAILNQASNSNVESNHHISHLAWARMNFDKQSRKAECDPR